MTSPKSRTALLAEMAARMMHTPALFDEACKRAAENIDKLDEATLAKLAGPIKWFTPEQIDLLLKIFPPDGLKPKGDETDPA
jgi:hypothetical protein